MLVTIHPGKNIIYVESKKLKAARLDTNLFQMPSFNKGHQENQIKECSQRFREITDLKTRGLI